VALQHSGNEVTLAECPVGLFMWRDTLVLKTKYCGRDGGIDAFVVSTGEFFLGDARFSGEQAKLMVQPIVEIDGERGSPPSLALELYQPKGCTALHSRGTIAQGQR
jgi:hypothetical protein